MENIKVDTHSQGMYHFTMGLKLIEGKRLSIVNLYLSLASNLNSKAQKDIRQEVYDALGDIPINDTIIVVRNLNAYIRGN